MFFCSPPHCCCWVSSSKWILVLKNPNAICCCFYVILEIGHARNREKTCDWCWARWTRTNSHSPGEGGSLFAKTFWLHQVSFRAASCCGTLLCLWLCGPLHHLHQVSLLPSWVATKASWHRFPMVYSAKRFVALSSFFLPFVPAFLDGASLQMPWVLRRLGVCIPVYLGAFGFLPLRKPVHLVLGEALELKCKVPGAPTDEEVQDAHRCYMEALKLGGNCRSLWNRWVFEHRKSSRPLFLFWNDLSEQAPASGSVCTMRRSITLATLSEISPLIEQGLDSFVMFCALDPSVSSQDLTARSRKACAMYEATIDVLDSRETRKVPGLSMAFSVLSEVVTDRWQKWTDLEVTEDFCCLEADSQVFWECEEVLYSARRKFSENVWKLTKDKKVKAQRLLTIAYLQEK